MSNEDTTPPSDMQHCYVCNQVLNCTETVWCNNCIVSMEQEIEEGVPWKIR